MSRHERRSVVMGRRHFLAAGAAIPAIAIVGRNIVDELRAVA